VRRSAPLGAGTPSAISIGGVRRGPIMSAEQKAEFFQLIYAVVGLSAGVAVATATALLGAAALFQ
jgi:hypothetical protein